MMRFIRRFFAAAAFFSLAACGPIYDVRYEYQTPPNPDRGCFAQCLTARAECRRDAQAQLAERDRENALCVAVAEMEENKKKRERLLGNCYSSVPLSFGDIDGGGGGCDSDYNACFVVCGGKVRTIEECVANCDAE